MKQTYSAINAAKYIKYMLATSGSVASYCYFVTVNWNKSSMSTSSLRPFFMLLRIACTVFDFVASQRFQFSPIVGRALRMSGFQTKMHLSSIDDPPLKSMNASCMNVRYSLNFRSCSILVHWLCQSIIFSSGLDNN